MNKKSNSIKFFTEYRDKNGVMHYAVQSYNNSDKTVSTLQDHKFTA